MVDSTKQKFSNELSEAQVERLAILAEEMGEALQCVGKILRHGYESCNPVVNTGRTNRRELEKEIGNVYAAILMLTEAKDINLAGVLMDARDKKLSIQQWLHHQAAAVGDGR
jgi:NTP pyrophosphatase (non-canonical NTP hydrolase)